MRRRTSVIGLNLRNILYANDIQTDENYALQIREGTCDCLCGRSILTNDHVFQSLIESESAQAITSQNGVKRSRIIPSLMRESEYFQFVLLLLLYFFPHLSHFNLRNSMEITVLSHCWIREHQNATQKTHAR